MNPRVSKIEWIIMYLIAAIIDIAQLLGVLFFLDPVIAVIMFIYFQFVKKVSLISKPGRLASIFGSEVLGNVTSGIAPLWILEVWYLQRSTKAEDAQIAAAKAEQDAMEAQYSDTLNTVNEDGEGVRLPRRSSQLTEQRKAGMQDSAPSANIDSASPRQRPPIYSGGVGKARGKSM